MKMCDQKSREGREEEEKEEEDGMGKRGERVGGVGVKKKWNQTDCKNITTGIKNRNVFLVF